jgi:predicted ester cyclase
MAVTADTVAENKELVRQEVASAWNEGSFDPAWYTEGFVYHGLAPDAIEYDAYTEAVSEFRTALPDTEKQVTAYVGEDDTVLARHHTTMTHEGDLMGIGATGESVDATGMVLYRVADGRIAEGWINYDALGIMQQIGAVSTP